MSNESENTSDSECWNSKKWIIVPTHEVEQIMKHFQCFIGAASQQIISQRVFGEQVKKDELAALKEKYGEQQFYRKFAQKECGICATLQQIYRFYSISMEIIYH